MQETLKLILLYLWAFFGIMVYIVGEGNKIYKSTRSKKYYQKAKALFDREEVDLYVKKGITDEDFEKNDLAIFKFMSFCNNRERYKIQGCITTLDDNNAEDNCKIKLYLYEKENNSFIYSEVVDYKDFWKVLDYFVEI